MSEPPPPSPSDESKSRAAAAPEAATATAAAGSALATAPDGASQAPVVEPKSEVVLAPLAETSDPEIRIARLSDPGVEMDGDASRLGGPPGPPPARKPRTAAPQPTTAVEAAFVQANLPQRSWPPETVADVMTRQLIALGEDEPLGDLESGMKRFRFRHLPVVGAAGKLVGLITRSDLLHAAAGSMPDGSKLDAPLGPKTPASAIMRRDVLTARLHTPITSAGRVMAHQKIGCLPVILDDNTLVGIVTETDFVVLALELIERR